MSEKKERQEQARKKKILCGNMLMSKCEYPNCQCEEWYKMEKVEESKS